MRGGNWAKTSSMCCPSDGGGIVGNGAVPSTMNPPRTTVSGRSLPGTFSNCVVTYPFHDLRFGEDLGDGQDPPARRYAGVI